MAINLKSKHRNSCLDETSKDVYEKPKARLHVWVDEDKYIQVQSIGLKRKEKITKIVSNLLDLYIEKNGEING